MNVTIEAASSGALYVFLSGMTAAIINGFVTWFVMRKQNETALIDLAVRLGIKEYEKALEVAKANGQHEICPPSFWVFSSYLDLKAAYKLKDNVRSIENFTNQRNKTSEAMQKTFEDEISPKPQPQQPMKGQ